MAGERSIECSTYYSVLVLRSCTCRRDFSLLHSQGGPGAHLGNSAQARPALGASAWHPLGQTQVNGRWQCCGQTPHGATKVRTAGVQGQGGQGLSELAQPGRASQRSASERCPDGRLSLSQRRRKPRDWLAWDSGGGENL